MFKVTGVFYRRALIDDGFGSEKDLYQFKDCRATIEGHPDSIIYLGSAIGNTNATFGKAGLREGERYGIICKNVGRYNSFFPHLIHPTEVTTL